LLRSLAFLLRKPKASSKTPKASKAFFATLRYTGGVAFVFLLRLHAKQAFGIFLRSKKCEASKPKAVKQARHI
jgi:hypothetical protein